MNLFFFLVKVREWNVPGNPLLHEFAVEAESLAVAIDVATCQFRAKYPAKDVGKYFLQGRKSCPSRIQRASRRADAGT